MNIPRVLQHEEWRRQMAQAVRTGDHEAAVRLSRMRQEAKKLARQVCRCGRAKDVRSDACHLCRRGDRAKTTIPTLEQVVADHIRRVTRCTRTLEEAALVLGVDRSTLIRYRQKTGNSVRRPRRKLLTMPTTERNRVTL